MIDRENVIEHLKKIAEYFRKRRSNLSFASKAENHFRELQNAASEAAELLKAQEPRVMTLKEIVSADCAWIEYATSRNIVIALPWDIELTDDTYNFIGMPNCFVEFRSLYGEEWRCWTARPTDEQREAAPWAE
jgi:hypothetical protein